MTIIVKIVINKTYVENLLSGGVGNLQNYCRKYTGSFFL